MINSKGSVVVGQERALDGLAGAVVVPDRGGQREDSLKDADEDSRRGVAAVSFEVKLSFEGVVDRLDDLAEGPEELRAGPLGLAFAGRAQQGQPGAGKDGLEVMAVVVLVADDHLAAAASGHGRVGEDVQQDLPLVGLGSGQGEPYAYAVHGA